MVTQRCGAAVQSESEPGWQGRWPEKERGDSRAVTCAWCPPCTAAASAICSGKSPLAICTWTRDVMLRTLCCAAPCAGGDGV